jgi:hypothetical protein
MGRPKVKIDWDEVGEMLRCGADVRSIAVSLGISPDTLYVRSKRDNKLDFSAFSQQKRAAGNDLLRRKQFEIAMSGNVSMLIWLGKNRLGQTDKQAISAEIKRHDEGDRLFGIVNHAKRVYEVFQLQPNGVTFDPDNEQHILGLREGVERAIAVRTKMDPHEASDYDDWEQRFERERENWLRQLNGEHEGL